MSERTFKPEEILIDRGFDTEFSWERINEFHRLFTDDELLQQFVWETHARDCAFDLKRGEFYPELLRAVLSLQTTLAKIYDIDPLQVQPNYGSNGSIDTIMTGIAAQESKRLSAVLAKLDGIRVGGVESTGEDLARLQRHAAEILAQRGVMMTSPTYFRNYNSASARQLDLHLVPLKSDFTLDTERFIREMQNRKPSAIFLVTPNNPTGIAIPDDELIAILDALPEGTRAVVDRTLANIAPEIPTVALLQRYKGRPVTILHSFSKYHGMSHLRIGVALYANAEFAKEIRPNLPLGNTLEGCIKANRIVLMEGGIHPGARIREFIQANRLLLDAFCKTDPSFRMTPFTANYCLLILPPGVTSETVTDMLAGAGLFVMGGHTFPESMPEVVRLHVGGPPEYISKMCVILSEKFGKGSCVD